jgi:hypothetical protein
MSQTHPYRAHEKDEIWRALEKGIKALAKNGDLALQRYSRSTAPCLRGSTS